MRAAAHARATATCTRERRLRGGAASSSYDWSDACVGMPSVDLPALRVRRRNAPRRPSMRPTQPSGVCTSRRPTSTWRDPGTRGVRRLPGRLLRRPRQWLSSPTPAGSWTRRHHATSASTARDPCGGDPARWQAGEHGPADLHRAPAGRQLRRPARGRPGRGGRWASARSSAPTTTSRWATRRAARAHRRVDHARRPGPGDQPDPARHADDRGHVPAARSAGDHGGAGRPDERRPGRARPRRRLVRRASTPPTASRSRHRRAVRPAGGAARDHHRPLGHAVGRDASPTPASTTSSRTRPRCPSRRSARARR